MIDLTQYPTKFLRNLLPQLKEELKRRGVRESAKKRLGFINNITINQYDDGDKLNKEISRFNRQSFRSVPYMEEKIQHRLKYVKDLSLQDWSSLFLSYENESKDFYVYAHVDPQARVIVVNKPLGNLGGTPFYIGKGKGNRAWDLKRNQGHGKAIKKVLDAGFPKESIVKIIKDGISEREAMELESKLIYFFSTLYENPKGGCLYNLDLSKRPDFIGEMQKYSKSIGSQSYSKSIDKSKKAQ